MTLWLQSVMMAYMDVCGADVESGYDSFKSSVFSHEWIIAEESASGVAVKLRGGIGV